MITNKSYAPLLVLGGFLLILAVGSQYFSPILIAAAICGALVAIFLIANPRALLFFAVLSLLFRGPFEAVSHMYKYVDDLFAILLLGYLVADHILKQRKLSGEEKKLFFPVVFFSIFSALFSRFGLSAVLKIPDFFITDLAFIIYFLTARKVLKEDDIPKIIKLFVVYMLFQFLCNVGYVLGINPIPQGVVNYVGDESTGTLGSGLYVAYYCLLSFFLVFSLIDNQAMKKKVGWSVFALLMFMNLILTNTNHAVFLLIVCLSLSGFFVWRRRFFKTILLIGMICAPLLWGLFMSINFKSAERGLGQIQATLSPDQLRYRFDRAWQGPKMRVYKKAFVEGQNNLPEYIFGVGGGCGISYDALSMDNPVAMAYLADIYLTADSLEQLHGGSITQEPIVSLSVLMVELGLIGVVCYYLTYLYLFFRTAFFYRKKRYSPNQMIIAGALCPFIILTLIVSLLTTAFYNEFYFVPVWVLAALVWTPSGSGRLKAAEKGYEKGVTCRS